MAAPTEAPKETMNAQDPQAAVMALQQREQEIGARMQNVHNALINPQLGLQGEDKQLEQALMAIEEPYMQKMQSLQQSAGTVQTKNAKSGLIGMVVGAAVAITGFLLAFKKSNSTNKLLKWTSVTGGGAGGALLGGLITEKLSGKKELTSANTLDNEALALTTENFNQLDSLLATYEQKVNTRMQQIEQGQKQPTESQDPAAKVSATEAATTPAPAKNGAPPVLTDVAATQALPKQAAVGSPS